ncbi:CHAT domain-containing protein [Dokdonia ponticola]|uniref:CHAT domain-containing protein n=1 Tax=Dokdonia ponticola TaxID=2041041 RepID=A0ABV9HU35_9FLAO
MYKPFYYFIVVIFGVLYNHQAYSQGRVESVKDNFDRIYTNYQLSTEDKIKDIHLLLSKADTITKTPELGYMHHKLGLLYNQMGLLESAIQETKKAIQIRTTLKDIDLKDVNNSLYNTYIYYKGLEKSQKGRMYLEKILENKGTDKFNFKALIELASLYMNEGDYFKALQNLEPVILSFDIYKDYRTFILGHLSCIEAYSKMSTPKKYLKKVSEHKEKIESLKDYISLKEIADMNTNLGTIFEKVNEKEKAIFHYEKALSLYTEVGDSNNIGTLYMNIAAIHSRKNEHKKAKMYYAMALKINEDPIKKADIYDNQGFYLQTKDPKQKINYYQKAIYTALGQPYDPTDTSQLPAIDSFKAYVYKPDVLGYLVNKASAWLDAYHLEKEQTYLIYAKETLYLIDQLVSLIRLDSELDQSKLFWINSGVDSYMLAVEVCYLLQEPEEAFYFMEKNKALLLLEHLDKRYAQQKHNIPEDILKKEKILLEKRITLKQQLQDTKNDIELQEEFVKIDYTYTRFLDSIKKTFPAYYTLKNEPTILSLQETIEKHVSKEASFIEYIVNETSGYGIFCANDKKTLFKIPNTPDLLQQVQFLKKELSAPFTTKEAFKRYRDTSFAVYQKLFPFLENAKKIDFKKLTIIPDYALYNLPFEALSIGASGNDYKPDYLLYHTETLYLHSASVFKQISKTTRKPTSTIIGFAPTIFKNKDLTDLKRSEEEMKTYASFLPMFVRLRKEATKSACLASLKDASIVHINSHAGYTENDTPWLELYDDKIILNELYDVANNTDLVILDACKSAQGKQEIGEGIMSLSRGFFYSGTRSVIASHWNVNEMSNNKILYTFYKKLKTGQTKSKALHTAKVSYLETHQLEQTSPYFWASITLTGDNSPIQLVQDNFWLKIVGLLICIGITIFALMYKKKKRLSIHK